MAEKMIIGGKEFRIQGKTYIMGILNVTPDSFSDGNQYNHLDRALRRVEEMIKEGADIIDIGGESTRPHATPLGEQEEIDRVIPFIREIKQRFDVPLSIDTYKGAVAKVAVENGIDLINDIWGLKYDNVMAEVIAKSGLPCCLMHNRKNSDYVDCVQEVLQEIKDSLKIAEQAGILDDKIILDPGIGFGKTFEQNLMITNHLEKFVALGYPVLLGASRKSMIGLALNLPIQERLEGTLVTSVMAVIKGVSFVRVHDVKQNKRAVEMAESIILSGR